MQQYKSCPSCGQVAFINAPTCLRCGHQFRTTFPTNPTQAFTPPPQAPGPPQMMGAVPPPPGYIVMVPGTHPVIAVIFVSGFIGGWAGALINRQYGKAFALLVGGVVLVAFTGCLGLLIWLALTFVDAMSIANRLNRGEPVRDWQFF